MESYHMGSSPQAIPDDPEGDWHDDIAYLDGGLIPDVWEACQSIGLDLPGDTIKLLAASLWWRLDREGGMGS
jgi:hypothetical protein